MRIDLMTSNVHGIHFGEKIALYKSVSPPSGEYNAYYPDATETKRVMDALGGSGDDIRDVVVLSSQPKELAKAGVPLNDILERTSAFECNQADVILVNDETAKVASDVRRTYNNLAADNPTQAQQYADSIANSAKDNRIYQEDPRQIRFSNR
jgi:hypothetical protein